VRHKLICRAIILAAAITCAAAFTAAGQALATPVSCGEVITSDTRLESDLTCPGKGIVIGADGITLDLNGHEVRSSSDCEAICPDLIGIDNSGGYDRVRILDGTVAYPSSQCFTPPNESCPRGVVLVGANQNRLSGLTIEAGFPGILLSDSDKNKISASSIGGGYGLHVGDAVHLRDGSDDNELVDSRTIWPNGTVAISDSTGNRLARDTISSRYIEVRLGSALGTTISDSELTFRGILAEDSDRSFIRHNDVVGEISIGGDRNHVEKNNVLGRVVNSAGFAYVPEAIGIRGGDGNVVRGNSTSWGKDGIRVESAATNTLVEANLATQLPPFSPCTTFFACDDGIDVEAPGTIVRANLATNNGDFGIEAVVGVIDRGGNRASGNGNPLQCLNVVCR
jgi:large repetitive protein